MNNINTLNINILNIFNALILFYRCQNESIMPALKKRRLNFRSPPSKVGVGSQYLTEHFADVPGSLSDVKNGHILYLFISNNRNVNQTERKLRTICNSGEGVSHYSIQRVIKNNLEKFQQLTDKKLMEKFMKGCADNFTVLSVTPRLKKTLPESETPTKEATVNKRTSIFN
jgi:hypothetical protein